MNKLQKTIFKASWLLPVSSPPIASGALMIENDIITAVGPAKEILSEKTAETKIVDFGDAVIAPSWVNAHTHLELSAFKNEVVEFTDFPDWIRQLLAARLDITQKEMAASAKEAMQQLVSSGCALAGDITNGDLISSDKLHADLERVVFYESFGFRGDRADEIFQQILDIKQLENPNAVLSPHALYSTSMELIQKIAAVSSPFTIHMAESPEESEFLQTGSGLFKDFLIERGVWDQKWQPPGCSPAEYLSRNINLDKNSLLVHGVHVSQADMDIIKKAGAAVCICARSNAHTNAGRAPVEKYLAKKIPLCIGTDSMACNVDLDMNNEIYYLYLNFPGTAPRDLIKAASLNGAEILGKGRELGSLQTGKKAGINVFFSRDAITTEPEEFTVSKSWSELKCF